MTVTGVNATDFSEVPSRQINSSTHQRKSHRRASALVAAPVDIEFNATAQKSDTIAHRVFNWFNDTRCGVWMWTKVFQVGCWGVTLGAASKTLLPKRLGEMLQFTYRTITRNTAFNPAKTTLQKSVDELSGSKHLFKFFEQIVPILTQKLQETLSHQSLWGAITNFLDRESATLEMFLGVLLPKIYINVAKSIRDEAESSDDELPPVTLVEVISKIGEVIQLHLPNIHARIEVLDKINDEERKQRKLLQLFTPLAQGLLSLILPEGVKELPLVKIPFASQHYWSKLQKEWLPQELLSLYRQLMAPFDQDKKNALKEMPGGDSLAALAETAVDQMSKSGYLLFAKKSSGREEKPSALTEMLIEQLTTMLEGSDAFKRWLGGWFGHQCGELSRIDHSGVNALWRCLGSYLEPLLNHIFYHLAKNATPQKGIKGPQPDALGIIAIKLFTIFNDFFNEHGQTVVKRVKSLRAQKRNVLEDEELLRLFSLLSTSLLKLMGIDKSEEFPIPSFLRQPVLAQVQGALPKILLHQYLVMKKSRLESREHHDKLKELFFDPKKLQDGAIATEVISHLYFHEAANSEALKSAFHEELWKLSGSEEIASLVDKTCFVLAHEILQGILTSFGVLQQSRLNIDSNPFMQKAWSFFHRIIHSMLLEVVVNITQSTEKQENGQEHPQKMLPLQLFSRLSLLFDKGLKQIEQRLHEIDEVWSSQPDRLVEERRQLFSQLATDLHSLVGSNLFRYLPLKGVPGADELCDSLWNAIKETVLPDLLYNVYSRVTLWQRQFPDSVEELREYYHTTHLYWTSHVLGQYVSDLLKNYLLSSPDEAASSTIASICDFFSSSSAPEGKAVSDKIGQYQKEIHKIFSDNFQSIAAKESEEIIKFWPLFAKHMEATLAKVFVQASRAIHAIEESHPDIMVDLAIIILKEVAAYFSVVNEATEAQGEEHPYRVELSSLLAAFEEQLHDGVPLDPLASQQDKEHTRMTGHFIPLTEKLMQLADISVDDFPLPEALRKPLGTLILKKIVPYSLMCAVNKLLEPAMRDSLMLSFVQKLYTTLNAIDPQEKEQEEEENRQDPRQKRLNETCGAVVLELVKMIPDTMVQYVFMKDKVKSMSAELIGRSIMPHLARWTLLQLIDTTVYHSLPLFHPAKWEGKAGKEALIPKRAFASLDGKKELKEVKKFKFIFPKTEIEIQELQQEKAVAAAEVRHQLREAFTKTISSQLRLKLWQFIKSLWDGLQMEFDDLVERQFSNKGRRFKALLDRFFHRVCFDIIGSAVHFLFSPLIRLVQFIIEKIYINKRADEIIENIHSEALEQLIYKVIDGFIDLFNKLKPESASVNDC